ncbi:MAG: hypothetical protein EBU49_01285 [Proteobacteria bacterium]|nr:hypothetical protein [Pseudomonadota bacterium]
MPSSNESVNPPHRLTVAIAGASGFVGRALIAALSPHCDIVALSRDPSRVTAPGPASDNTGPVIKWRRCDLFSALETENALAGCDVAIYLVHSMLPSARLTQGKFEDLDLMIADNFGRAAKACGISRIIYLGGIIPADDLSRHLASRLEVEQVLAEHGVPLVALRAGLVVGRNGSSFDMMRKLVERLPLMVCPKWTRTRSCPVAIDDVVAGIAGVVGDPGLAPGAYDLGGSETITYLEMMKAMAQMMGKRRLMIPVFLFSPKLSRLWVRLVTGAPKELVGPLVESLRHEMIPRDQYIFNRYGIAPASFREAISKAIAGSSVASPRKVPKVVRSIKTVCSVQRLPLPAGRSAHWAADRYAHWLIRFFWPFIVVERTLDGSLVFKFRFFFKFTEISLLYLTYVAKRSTAQRQLFFITGGALTDKNARKAGRFEFREVLKGTSFMAAIFDYSPALPWWVYKNTQAFVHLFVMHSYRRYLTSIARRSAPVLLFAVLPVVSALFPFPASARVSSGLYELSAESIDGTLVPLSKYKGNVALLVNTASRCGFTDQYKDLQAIYEKYKSKGFVVLGFPSNDFSMQEPGSNKEIKKFCDLNFRVKFPMFAKGKVLGPSKQPVYRFLTDGKNFNGEISWNFEKFLINRKGEVVGRFDPAIKPLDSKVTNRIEEILSSK